MECDLCDYIGTDLGFPLQRTKGANRNICCNCYQPEATTTQRSDVLSEFALLARKSCHFTYNDENDEWFTDCGDSFGFNGGNPQDGRMNFCPNCGGRVFF